MDDHNRRPEPITSLTQVEDYDKYQHEYSGLPGSLKTHPTTIRVVPQNVLQPVKTWIVQTIRATDLGGDLVFIDQGALHLVLPPQVTTAIARQRDALTGKARSRAARDRARTGDASHLQDPAIRRKALETRKAKAAKRRATRQSRA
jgi:hypothetical protein